MERLQSILENGMYGFYVTLNETAEKDRIFCKHDPVHFLDVARIGQIINLQENFGLTQEMIYAAALLHDIGRWQQYETGEDHAAAGARLAKEILEQCGFLPDETEQICGAIASHRDSSVKEEKNLRGLLYRADKLSRPCFLCKAEQECDWKEGKKNLQLNY
ncbi:MAG: HD domain-containing protein [Lachnospiraceae bacterium]|nr:HD domain-containing protein [Lachnospiraceae bacterium]